MKKLLFIASLIFFSCKSKNNTIIKCVITDVKQFKSENTLEYEPYFIYTTECGTEVISHRIGVYNIGDTIFYKKG